LWLGTRQAVSALTWGNTVLVLANRIWFASALTVPPWSLAAIKGWIFGVFPRDRDYFSDCLFNKDTVESIVIRLVLNT